MAKTLSNADVARIFDEVGDLLEIKGVEGFRINAYRKAARTLRDLGGDIHTVAAEGRLGELPGIGKSSVEKIEEILETGDLKQRRDLVAEVPETLLELLKLPNTGPKRVATLWKEAGIETLSDLEQALEAGRLEDLKGFGEKTRAQLREGLDFLKRSEGRHRLSIALAVANQLCDRLRNVDGVERVESAGSLRRGRETVGDLDLLCLSADSAAVIKAFTQQPNVTKVLGAGDTKASVLFEYRARRTMQVDLRVVEAESFGAAWLYFTGSKEHNVRLRERAIKRGWSLNEYGLWDGEELVAGADEASIYEALELPWLPPEFREDRFEFELEAVPEDLLTVGDIRSDLHMHTEASDGHHSIEEMIAAAKGRGYDLICITDHSASSVIANGLSAERLAEHAKAVRAAAKQAKGITVWAGAEVDVLADGSLDYPDEVLAELDWVVASLHTGMGDDRDANTERTLKAIRSPYVNLIAHPTARLLNRREAKPLDIETLGKVAAETGTALEINASDQRLDLKDTHARLAREMGAVIAINTDAHSVEDFEQLKFGVVTARRAGLLRDDVLNTWPVKRVRAFVKRKRG